MKLFDDVKNRAYTYTQGKYYDAKGAASSYVSSKANIVAGTASEMYNAGVDKINSLLNGSYAGSIFSEESFGGTATPHPTGSPTDVEYGSPSSFKSITQKIKARYGLPSSPEDSKMLERHYINRLNINLIDNVFSHLRCYVFMGRPTCNLMNSNGDTTDTIKRKANLNSLIEDDIELFKFLCADVPANTDFLTPLQNRVLGLSIQDATMSKSESAASTRGIRQEYPMSYEESMANIPMNITFKMDRNAEVLRLLYVWITYMEELKKGTVQQAPEDQALNRMGYTFPMWIFACEENSTDIVFFAKTVGNMPMSIPFSIFSNQGAINTEAKEVSVSFQCSLFRPFDIAGLAEFNMMSENRAPKYYLDQWVPFEDRNMDYYWVNGAEVVKDRGTGKYRLVFFTTDYRYGD